MEPQKIILDMLVEDMGQGLTEVVNVMSQYPNQEVGKEFAIRVTVNGRPYDVVRNLNSYSIRQPYGD